MVLRWFCRRWATVAAVLFGGLLLYRLSTVLQTERQARLEARRTAERTALNVTRKLEKELMTAERVISEMASADAVLHAALHPELRTYGTASVDGTPTTTTHRNPIFDVLQNALSKYPDLYHVAVLYLPSNGKLYAPTIHRISGKVDEFYRETLTDYTRIEWFRAGLLGPQWREPEVGKLTGKYVLNFVMPIKAPSGEVHGVAIGSISLEGISRMVNRVSVGQDGYLFLVSKGGRYLYDPNLDYTERQRTLFQVGREEHDNLKLKLASAVAHEKSEFGEQKSGLTGRPTWVFLDPIGSTGMYRGLTIIREAFGAGAAYWRKAIIELCGLAVLFLLSAAQALCIRFGPVAVCGTWKGSAAVAALLTLAIAITWTATLQWPELNTKSARRVFDSATARAMLSLPHRGGALPGVVTEAPMRVVSVGVQFESLAFNPQGDASITGLLWERLEDGTGEMTKPVPLEFPSAINVKLGPWTKQMARGYVIHLTTFELTLRQPHKNPRHYPLDGRQLKLRIRSADAFGDVGLIPDFDAFPVIAPTSKPGLAAGLTASGWWINNSFFALRKVELSSLPRLEGLTMTAMPELLFNVQLRRRLLDAFVSALLPALVVAALLFVFVSNVTTKPEVASAIGYKHMDTLRSMSALLFPALVAQINIRSKTLAEELLYVDYFYFVLYAAILLSSCAVVWISYEKQSDRTEERLRRLKLSFWPSLMGAYYAVTFCCFWD
jgi:hypothetical protein